MTRHLRRQTRGRVSPKHRQDRRDSRPQRMSNQQQRVPRTRLKCSLHLLLDADRLCGSNRPGCLQEPTVHPEWPLPLEVLLSVRQDVTLRVTERGSVVVQPEIGRIASQVNHEVVQGFGTPENQHDLLGLDVVQEVVPRAIEPIVDCRCRVRRVEDGSQGCARVLMEMMLRSIIWNTPSRSSSSPTTSRHMLSRQRRIPLRRTHKLQSQRPIHGRTEPREPIRGRQKVGQLWVRRRGPRGSTTSKPAHSGSNASIRRKRSRTPSLPLLPQLHTPNLLQQILL